MSNILIIILDFIVILISMILNFLINSKKFNTIEELKKIQNTHEERLKNQVDVTEKMKKDYELKLRELEKDLKSQVDATKEMEKKYELEIEKLRLNKQNELNPNMLFQNPDMMKWTMEIMQEPEKLEKLQQFRKNK